MAVGEFPEEFPGGAMQPFIARFVKLVADREEARLREALNEVMVDAMVDLDHDDTFALAAAALDALIPILHPLAAARATQGGPQ